MFHVAWHTSVVFVALLPVTLSAQKPMALSKPDAELKEPFAQVASVRELRDGRVLVAGPRDKLAAALRAEE